MEQVQLSYDQMNEIICEFMGGHRLINGAIHVYKGPDEIEWETGRYLKYHTSWDWLMDVVERIEDVALDKKGGFILRSAAQVKIYYQACRIIYVPDEESGDDNEEIFIQTKGRTKIESVYEAVYQFIQWHNQQKQSI